MTQDKDDLRFAGGPRPLGALIPRLTRPAFRKRSPAGALLMADWPAMVGPALAAVTTPRRLSGGTLTIACAGPVAMELTHYAPQLIARLNGATGRVLVERLRFVQAAAGEAANLAAVGAAQAAREAAPAALPAPVEAALSGVRQEALREALEKLARGVYRNRR